MKCDNCSNEAAYTHADPGVNPVYYCTKCLPHWLHARANAGHLPLVSPTAKVAEKSVDVKVEEVTEGIKETPADVKKVTKKKAAIKSTAVPTEEAPTSESN